MKRAADYPENAVEQTILTPGDFGLDDIASVSYSRYTKNWRAMPPHVHEGCLELCYCRRGSLQFECAGKRYTVLPDDIFLSQPGDVHHLLTNHKGVICYWLVFRYPKPDHPALVINMPLSPLFVDYPMPAVAMPDISHVSAARRRRNAACVCAIVARLRSAA